MKLWDKGFQINELIESFTIGRDRELDLYLAKYDVQGCKAQANMLQSTGFLTDQENRDLQEALDDLDHQISQNTFVIDAAFEDVHSKIEAYLVEKCGDAGKKVHTARSRNDQVLVALQLFLKDYLQSVEDKTLEVIEILLQKADEFKDVLIPGYTHFQAAMPSSFGLWFTAYAENLLSDLHFVKAAFRIADQNPLGSGAGFGTSFAINREMTTQELGFESMAVSAVGAQMLRGKSEKATALAIQMPAATLSKLSYDLVQYNSQDLGFVHLPKEMTTGSSIMPHKKNPDVFELTRAHCNRVQGLAQEITLIINNLPSGYHRDFQIIKEVLFEPAMHFLKVLDLMIFSLPKIEVNNAAIQHEKYDAIYTVENINALIQKGVPFRDAYRQVGLEVESGDYEPLKEFKTHHIGSIHNLGIDKIREKIQKFKNQ